VFKIIRSKEAGQNGVFAGSKKFNLDNLDNERREANGHFRKRERNILKPNLIILKLTD
jgi:hypothetical protein